MDREEEIKNLMRFVEEQREFEREKRIRRLTRAIERLRRDGIDETRARWLVGMFEVAKHVKRQRKLSREFRKAH